MPHAMGSKCNCNCAWCILKKQNWKHLAKYGAKKVLHVQDEKLKSG